MQCLKCFQGIHGVFVFDHYYFFTDCFYKSKEIRLSESSSEDDFCANLYFKKKKKNPIKLQLFYCVVYNI